MNRTVILNYFVGFDNQGPSLSCEVESACQGRAGTLERARDVFAILYCHPILGMEDWCVNDFRCDRISKWQHVRHAAARGLGHESQSGVQTGTGKLRAFGVVVTEAKLTSPVLVPSWFRSRAFESTDNLLSPFFLTIHKESSSISVPA